MVFSGFSWCFQANKVKLKFSHIRSNSKLASALVRAGLLSTSCCAHAVPGTCVQTACHRTGTRGDRRPRHELVHVWCGAAAGAWRWTRALCQRAAGLGLPSPVTLGWHRGPQASVLFGMLAKRSVADSPSQAHFQLQC